MLDDEALLAADPSAKSLIDSGVPRQEVIAGLRGQASGDASAAATPFAAAVITPPSVEELAVAENRKMVLRALDSKISKQDAPSALAAIELALKLVTNIISHPSEPKYKKFRANNPAISQKLLRCPGGQVNTTRALQEKGLVPFTHAHASHDEGVVHAAWQDLILALGFRTKVVEFEEQWVADDGPLLMRTLAECTPLLENYRDLERKKVRSRDTLRSLYYIHGTPIVTSRLSGHRSIETRSNVRRSWPTATTSGYERWPPSRRIRRTGGACCPPLAWLSSMALSAMAATRRLGTRAWLVCVADAGGQGLASPRKVCGSCTGLMCVASCVSTVDMQGKGEDAGASPRGGCPPRRAASARDRRQYRPNLRAVLGQHHAAVDSASCALLVRICNRR